MEKSDSDRAKIVQMKQNMHLFRKGRLVSLEWSVLRFSGSRKWKAVRRPLVTLSSVCELTAMQVTLGPLSTVCVCMLQKAEVSSDSLKPVSEGSCIRRGGGLFNMRVYLLTGTDSMVSRLCPLRSPLILPWGSASLKHSN